MLVTVFKEFKDKFWLLRTSKCFKAFKDEWEACVSEKSTSAPVVEIWSRIDNSVDQNTKIPDCNNNNNNKHDNVYGAVIMAEPLREFTRFIWWM